MMRYAGFWSRLWANAVDTTVFGLPALLLFPLQHRSLAAALILLALMYVAGIAYPVYCHGRWGQTVGKMVAGIRVVDASGARITWRQAFLRSSVDAVLAVAIGTSTMVGLFRMTPDEYVTPDRWRHVAALSPFYGGLTWANWGWFWGELVVLLFNRRKRALHDFIAGTVVIHTRPAPAFPDPDRLGILPMLDRR